MKRIALAAVLAVFVLAIPLGARSEVGHFMGGVVNIRDYFVPAETGVYGAVYGYYYSTDRFNDDHGDEIDSVVVEVSPGPGPSVSVPIDLDVDLDLYAVTPALIWVSDWKVLGVRYAALIAPSFANASVEAQLSIARRLGGDVENSSFAVGDMLVQPIWFGWSSEHFDVSAAYGFYAPIGKYDTDTVTTVREFTLANPVVVEDPDNIGYGFWTQQVQTGLAWYPFDNKGTAVTGVITYEYHSEKEDFDVQPGQNLTLNWGISQYLPLTSDQNLLLEIGPAGWNSWQLSADEGSDVTSRDRDRTHAVGGQLGLTYVPWNLAFNFHGFYEYSTKARFQGTSLGLSLSKKFF